MMLKACVELHVRTSYDKKWRQFERLVAAIHRAKDRGGVVTWDDRIQGRQFDVTLRFRHGLYQFLVVIECKDSSTAVPIGDVEAFVTKSRDCKADKAVVVSANGFQSGCFEVARTHNIQLFSLREVEDAPERWLTDQVTPSLCVDNIEFDTACGVQRLRDEGGSLNYYMDHTSVVADGGRWPLWALINATLERSALQRGAGSIALQVELPMASRVVLPHNDGELDTSVFRFRAGIEEARIMRHPVDPALIPKMYAMHDEITGAQHCFSSDMLALGHDTVLAAGVFYVNPHIHFYYYCRSVVDNIATFLLVESYQHGMLVQANIRQHTRSAGYYVEVRDDQCLRRLRFLLDRFDRLRSREVVKTVV